MIQKAGFPPGVFNILSGHGQLSGAILSSHMDVRVLSFTGSGRTGRQIQIAAAKSNLKNVILELGGKSPAIIFDDADLEQAARETQNSIQWNSGQICMANSRIYVQKSVSNRFVELFKERNATFSMGDPTHIGTNYGPQVDEVQHKSIVRYIEQGKKEEGTLILGGGGNVLNGFFIEPTIFTDMPEDATVMKEEIFGPVVIINTFQSEEEAIKKANDTEYGLYAAVYTKNLDRAMRMAKAIEAGSVGINCTSPTGAHDMPFGGYKASGVGREGWLYSVNNYLETKTVLVKVESI
jgi:aldehyde dehydrogenase (NAD+)